MIIHPFDRNLKGCYLDWITTDTKLNTRDNILILSQDIELMIKYNIKKLISCVDCIEINVNNKMVSLKIPFEMNNKTYNIVKYVSIWHTNNITLEVENLLGDADKMITNIKLGGTK